MRKVSELNLTELLMARVLTFLQELTYKLHILSSGRLSDFLGKVFDRISAAHFELFFGMDLDKLCKQIGSGVLDKKTARSLTFKALKPFADRQVKLQSKILRIYKGRDINISVMKYLSAVLTVQMFTERSMEDVSQEMMQLMQEKIDAARKAS